MLESGLCKNSRCKLLHPKICKYMFYRGYCPRGNSCWFTHPPKCENNQQNNNNNIQNNVNNNMSHYRQNNNIQNKTNSNNQIMNTSNGNFLGPWPTLGNVNYSTNPGINQMQPMMQMMQNMMDRISRMDNKLMHIEMGRQIYS